MVTTLTDEPLTAQTLALIVKHYAEAVTGVLVNWPHAEQLSLPAHRVSFAVY